MARYGPSRHVVARRSKAGMACCGVARQVWHGLVRRVWVRFGRAGKVRHGIVRYGTTRIGAAFLGGRLLFWAFRFLFLFLNPLIDEGWNDHVVNPFF